MHATPDRVETVTSRRNPLVRRCRSIAGGDDANAILLVGRTLVAEALAAGVAIETAIVSSRTPDERPPGDDDLAGRLRRAGGRLVRATTSVMDALSPTADPVSVVAIGSRPAGGLATLLATGPQRVLVAVDVQDPGNLGAIVRVAHAAGLDPVVAAGACADPFGWKALRGAMGSSLHRPPLRARDTTDALAALARAGLQLIGSVPRGGRPFHDADLRPPLAVVLGGEGSGLPPHALACLDHTISIPMQRPVESLNVAVAAGIVAYEMRRQGTPGHDER